MSNRPTATSLALLAVLLLGTSALSISTAIAQNAIPFTHIIIDPSPPLQSHCKAVGDIDGDGFPDVMVGSAEDGYGFFWYRYPEWTKYTIVPPGVTGYTTDMQMGDVDGDGDLDAIIPKGFYKGKTVFWYENPRPLGDPSIDAWIEHLIGAAPAHDVEVGDVNNDGKLDVVVRDGKTTVFVQNTPTSWSKNEINTRAIEGTSLGDIDGDGDLDVAINGYWLENPMPSGNPATDGWSEYVITTNWPTYAGALIVDLNEDGRMDVALSPSETTGRFSWFEAPISPKDGGWIEHAIDATSEYLHTFKAFDMDLDGDLDLITAEMLQSSNPDEVCVYINQGGGASWFKQVIATTGSHNIRVADIGSDGDMDIVGINWQGTTPLEMWQNDLDPQFSLDDWDRHVVDTDKPWRAVLIDAGDLDGDALPDIVTGGWWYRNPGDPAGNWGRSTLGSPLNNMAALHDFDGDGRLDVLGTQGTGSANNPAFAWARNNGQGSFTILQNIPSGTGDFLQGVAVDQFQSQGGDQVMLSWHAGGGGVQRLTLPADPVSQTWTWESLTSTDQHEDLSVGDIDRDGNKDLLLGTLWLRNDGASWSTHTVTNTNSIPDRNELADINGDGRLDAVVGFEFENKLSWYEQGPTATNTWTEHSIATDFSAPMSLDVGDLDRDGDLDVVVGEHDLSNPGSALLYVYENNGGGASWTAHEVYTGDEHHDGTQLVDIDNDGDLDIISIGWTHGRVLLYENKSGGGGPLPNRPPVASFSANPTSGEAPLDVNFDASGSSDPDGDLLTYSWNFGDGGTGTGMTVAHTFTQSATFQVTLTVSDGEFTGNASRTIFATGPPDTTGTLQAHWPLDESGGTIATDIVGTSDGTLLNGPVWQPGAGKLAGALEFDGVDDLVDLGPIDVTDGSGLTIALWVRVDGFPIADSRFISKASGTTDADHYWMLGLINSSGLRFRLKLDGVTQVLMTGSGQVALGQWYHMAASYDGTAMRIYKNGVEVGSMPVTGQLSVNPGVSAALANQPPGAGQRGLDGRLDDVRIYNYALSESEIVKLADAEVNQQPVASFTATPTSGEAPLDVNFDASNSSDPDGDVLSYGWDFGDGGTGSGATAAHTFTEAGTFDVTLTVDDGALTANASQTVTVTNPPNQPPVASFTADPMSGTVPLDVSFDASGSSDPDGDAMSYLWDFGGGNTATGITAMHTFTETGTFQVRLWVSDGTVNSNTSRTILVTSAGGLADSLQAFWPLDETSGVIASDIAGVRDGTLLNGPLWQPSGGRVAGALQFDGVDDLVDLGAVDVSGGSGLTIALWAQVDAFSIPDGRFISKATGTADDDHYWMLGMIDDSALRFRLKLDATTRVLATNSGQVIPGQWVHVAASYDGTTMRIYRNGTQVASMPATGQVAVNPGVSAALGSQPLGTDGRPLDGMLDDVRIYNYALSESEIMDLADVGSSNGQPVASFTANPTSGEAPLPVNFDASDSSDPDGDMLTYVWDFGDGTVGIGATTSHTFTQTGVFQVTLTANDGELIGTDTETVTVAGAPGVFNMVVGILQNPYLSQFLDIYVAGSEPLDPSTLEVTAQSLNVTMTLFDAENNIWQGQHELTTGGIVSIKACAETLDSRYGCASTLFSAGFVVAGGGASLNSSDNTFTVRIPEGGVTQDGYLLVMPTGAVLSDDHAVNGLAALTESDSEENLAAFTVSPGDLVGGTIITVEFLYADLAIPEGIELSQIYVEQVGVGPLESYIDERAGVIRATSRKVGEFVLKIGAPGVSDLADLGFAKLHQNFPNPFNPSTTIQFELQSSQRVEIAIYDVAGRFVARLLDEEVSAGIGRIGWDGRSDRGEAVGSGVYFVRLTTPDATAIRKLLLVR